MKKVLCMFVMATVILMLGCDKVLDENDPVSVARAFWTTVLSATPEDAKPFMVNGDELPIGIRGQSDQDTAVLGKVDQQSGYYFIETTVQLFRNGKLVSVPMRTVVVPVDGLWRVDYWSTKQTIFDATFDTSMRWFASTLENADIYIDDILGVESDDDALKFAEQRLTEEFARVKQSILKNYKARFEAQTQQKASHTQPAG
jgi:hypothetical protein